MEYNEVWTKINLHVPNVVTCKVMVLLSRGRFVTGGSGWSVVVCCLVLRSVVNGDELDVVSATGVVVVFIVPDQMQRIVIQIQTMIDCVTFLFSDFYLSY